MPQGTYLQLQQRCASPTWANIQPRPQPMPARLDSKPCGHAAPACGIMVYTPTIHVITRIATHLPTQGGGVDGLILNFD